MFESASAYTQATWRLLVDKTPASGRWNMALDEAIMHAVSTRESPPTLRLYQWNPTCLSLGKRQPSGDVDLEACKRDGVDVVRRATGGLAILHTEELTYSVVTTQDDARAAGAILDAYRRLSEGLVAALRIMGIQAEMTPVAPSGSHGATPACFEAPSAYELIAHGRKILGSAQTRPQGKVLQHGSLPLTGDIGRAASYLRAASPSDSEALRRHLREHATTVLDVTGRMVSFDEAAAAFTQGFAAALNVVFEPGLVSSNEHKLASEIALSKAFIDGAETSAIVVTP